MSFDEDSVDVDWQDGSENANPVIETYVNRINELKKKVDQLEKEKSGMVEMKLTFQPYIDGPPVQGGKETLFQQACSNDGITLQSWEQTWIDYAKKNAELFDTKNNSIMSEHKKNYQRPAVIAGSGPSLKKNAKLLAEKSKDTCVVSCLHNFAYFEDIGVDVDYYVNLDSGDITIPEFSQGGSKDPDYYWELTKDKVLVTATVGNPELIRRWRGKVLFFNAIAPNEAIFKALIDSGSASIPFFNVGGNTLGACMYLARAILGSSMIAFVGADFSFSYNQKFHPFDSPYDQQYAGLMPATDVYGNRVYTWGSYYNFKCWFDYIAMGGKGENPYIYINCTEGGILGSYPEGNIRDIRQMTLKDFFRTFDLTNILPETMKDLEEKRELTLLF